MTNDQLNQIKIELDNISVNINQLVNTMNSLGKNVTEIDMETQPEEFKEASVLYSKSKNQLTAYLLSTVDRIGLTLLDVIEFAQSTPKAKLWVP